MPAPASAGAWCFFTLNPHPRPGDGARRAASFSCLHAPNPHKVRQMVAQAVSLRALTQAQTSTRRLQGTSRLVGTDPATSTIHADLGSVCPPETRRVGQRGRRRTRLGSDRQAPGRATDGFSCPVVINCRTERIHVVPALVPSRQCRQSEPRCNLSGL